MINNIRPIILKYQPIETFHPLFYAESMVKLRKPRLSQSRNIKFRECYSLLLDLPKALNTIEDKIQEETLKFNGMYNPTHRKFVYSWLTNPEAKNALMCVQKLQLFRKSFPITEEAKTQFFKKRLKALNNRTLLDARYYKVWNAIKRQDKKIIKISGEWKKLKKYLLDLQKIIKSIDSDSQKRSTILFKYFF